MYSDGLGRVLNSNLYAPSFWRSVQSAVGCSVALKCTSRRYPGRGHQHRRRASRPCSIRGCGGRSGRSPRQRSAIEPVNAAERGEGRRYPAPDLWVENPTCFKAPGRSACDSSRAVSSEGGGIVAGSMGLPWTEGGLRKRLASSAAPPQPAPVRMTYCQRQAGPAARANRPSTLVPRGRPWRQE